MKLEVGMYVRYKQFTYDKVVKIGKLTNVQFQEVDNCSGRQIILKASHNIIDLIEVGDYVNGFPVIHKENDILKCGLLVQFKENEIKSIVTKENFESMSYKVGE